MSAGSNIQEVASALLRHLERGTIETDIALTGIAESLNGSLDREVLIGVLSDLSDRLLPPLTALELFTTSECNLSCKYCFVDKQNPERMSEETAIQAIDFLLANSGRSKRVELLFFGGEPLLELSLIEKCAVYIRAKATEQNKIPSLNITTNGTLLDEEVLSLLKRHNIRFLISVDGGREVHDSYRTFPGGIGTFETIASIIPLAKRSQPWLGARMTVMPSSAHLIADNFIELTKMGFNQVIIAPAEGVLWKETDLIALEEGLKKYLQAFFDLRQKGFQIRSSFLEQLLKSQDFGRDRWGCRAGRHSFAVLPSGEILPCSKLFSPETLRTASVLGNISEGINNYFLRFRLNHTFSSPSKECISCTLADVCSGGCYAVNFWDTGDMFSPSPMLCGIEKIYSKVRSWYLSSSLPKPTYLHKKHQV